MLITGGSGFIGGTLARRLSSRAHQVVAPSKGSLDLVGPEACASLSRLEGVDVVVHCAASRGRADPSPSRFGTETAINVQAAAMLYEWALCSGVRSIIHLSTLSVVQPEQDPGRLLDEGSPTIAAPAHPYALTKRWAEDLVLSFRTHFEAAAIVRPGMVYGRGQSPGSGMGRLVAAVLRGDSYPLAGGTGHRLAPVHIDDVVDVLLKLVEQPRNVTVMVGGPTPLFERQVIEDIADLTGVAARFDERSSERPMSMAPSSKLADELFPARRRTPWPEGSKLGLSGAWRS